MRKSAGSGPSARGGGNEGYRTQPQQEETTQHQRTVERIPSEYSPSGFEYRLPDGGTRPEQTTAEREATREADKSPYREIKTRYRLTDDEFEALRAGTTFFPKPIGHRTSQSLRTFQFATEAIFYKSHFEEFFDRLRTLAALDRRGRR